MKFILSSLSSSAVDFVAFTILTIILNFETRKINLLVSIIAARIISSIYNYFVNYKVVFSSGLSLKKTILRYYLLAIVQMFASYFILFFISDIFDIRLKIITILLKAAVDVFLFFISYRIQREWVFK